MNVLRSSSHAVVFLIFLMSTQGVVLMQGVFLLNRDFIANHLCENRDRPELKCNGACFLKKQIEAHHDHHGERQPDAGLPVLSGITGLVAPPVYVPDAPMRERAAPFPEGYWSLPDGIHGDIFHPPRAV